MTSAAIKPIDAQQVRAFGEAQVESHLKLLKSWVAINSFTLNPIGVNLLGEVTATSFEELGFSSKHIPAKSAEHGKHVVLSKPGTGARSLGFVSHLDTVYPIEEELRCNFKWNEAGDKIYGPGTIDIKGGTMMIHLVCRTLKELLPALYDGLNLHIFLNAAEEHLAEDFPEIVTKTLPTNALACLIFECSNFADGKYTFVNSRKGLLDYQVTVEGRAAHSGKSHSRGASAIRQMARFIEGIESLTDHGKELTFNVGTISGGTAANVVPAMATIHGEMRAFDQQIFEAGEKALWKLLAEPTVKSEDDGCECKVKISHVKRRNVWPLNPATQKLASLWTTAASAQGMLFESLPRGGLSDGNFLWDKYPVIDGLGPAGANLHCAEMDLPNGKEAEYLLRSSIVPMLGINVRAITKLAGA